MKIPGLSQVEKGEHRTQAFFLCIWAYVRFAAVIPLLLLLYRCCWTVFCADAFEIQRKCLGDKLLLPGWAAAALVMPRLHAMSLEVAAEPNMKVLRSRYQMDPPQQYPRTEASCTAVCDIFPVDIHEHIHTKAPWHEDMSSKLDFCCARGGLRCEVARRCEPLRCYTHTETLWSFVWVSIVMLVSGSAESDPVKKRQLARL